MDIFHPNEQLETNQEEQNLLQIMGSDTLVNAIAFNAPTIDLFNHRISLLERETESYKQKRHSFCGFVGTETKETKPVANTSKSSILTPLSEYEKSYLQHKFLSSHNSNLAIDIGDEFVIENSRSTAIHSLLNYEQMLLNSRKENFAFIGSATTIMEKFDQLLSIHDNVINQTHEFKSTANSLIQDLDKLQLLYTELNEKLNYFNSIDSIIKVLNSTSSNSKIVLKSSFHTMLMKLDQSLAFVNEPENGHIKDIKIYKFRFNQCMIRALSMIRNYLISHLKNIELKTLSQITNLDANEDNSLIMEALINSNFNNDTTIYDLFFEIYSRVVDVENNLMDDSSDYFNLLDDVYNEYFKIRENLLVNYMINRKLNEINNNSDLPDSLIEISNVNLNFFRKTFEKEFEIFKTLFFLTPNKVTMNLNNSTNLSYINKFFERLLEPLYYLLRNKIIRESNINSLCELINLLNSFKPEWEQDQDILLNNYQTNYYDLFKPILFDCQTRLVFTINKFIQQKIINYKNTGSELIISNKTNYELIYPPILKSIQLLNKIYQLINKSIFDDISSSIVHVCIVSLKENFKTNDSIDCKLYQIKSLILFKNSINQFEIDIPRKETSIDFSGISKLFRRETNKIILKSNEYESLFDRILGTIPKVVSNFIDCKVELQIEIRNIVHEFIKISTKRMFLSHLLDIQDAAALTVSQVEKVNTTIVQNIQTELSRLKDLIGFYINDYKIITFLIDGINEEINSQYVSFVEIVNSRKDEKLSAALLDLDHLNNVWIKSVKTLFTNEAVANVNDDFDDMQLLDIQKDLDGLDIDVTNSVTPTDTTATTTATTI